MGAESKDPEDFYRSKDRLREFDQCSVPEKTDAFCICGTGTPACAPFSNLNAVDRRRPRLRHVFTRDTRVAQHRGSRRMRFLHLPGVEPPPAVAFAQPPNPAPQARNY
jgi:hypothetical protein